MGKLWLLSLRAVAGLNAADKPWPWIGPQSREAVTILLHGDINVERRPEPADALRNVLATLNSADVLYGNLEGLLVRSEGPDKDIPDKTGCIQRFLP